MRRRLGWIALLTLVACGSSRPSVERADREARAREQAELEALAARREALDREAPVSPYVDERVRIYRPAPGCSQGPHRLTFDAIGASHGERVSVYACSPGAIEGTYRLRSGDQPGTPRAFGPPRMLGEWRRSTRCTPTQGERTAAGVSTSTEASPGAAGAPSSRAVEAEPEASAVPTELEAVASEELARCPRGSDRQPIANYIYESVASTPPLQPGLPIVVELWSELPNDLTDVFFVVDQDVVRRDMTTDEWLAYREALAAHRVRERALLDEQLAAGVAHVIDDTPRVAEPPPAPRAEERPPRPSEHAEWIAGYWHFEARWSWMPGWWRVPQADVDADLVVRSASLPPAPRTETPPAKPAHDAVWAPGSWQWDGHAYLWIGGAWRIPPSTRHRWRPSGWRRQGAFAIFLPGGWIVSP